jgi:hypothetical protein
VGRRRLGITGNMWEDNIKVDLMEMGCEVHGIGTRLCSLAVFNPRIPLT